MYDEIAENYSEIADVDDGSCTYIYGCQDSTASNYNADATVEDNSCEYACNGVQLVANVSGGSYANEMSWNLQDAEGNEIVSGTGTDYSTAVPFCESAGEYTFNAIDSYGDGWKEMDGMELRSLYLPFVMVLKFSISLTIHLLLDQKRQKLFLQTSVLIWL
jgi:hypothetical protein